MRGSLGIFKTAILFSGLWIAVASWAQTTRYPFLNQEGYEDLQRMAAKILKECPPPDCLVAFPGRSNILLSAYMEARGFHNHVNLPVSGIRGASVNQVMPGMLKVEVFDPLLKPHLAHAKKIVVVDYVHEGGSLAMISRWMQTYSERIQPEIQLQAMGYGEKMKSEYREALTRKKISYEHIPTLKTPGSVLHLTDSSLLEEYAPYDSWYPNYAEEGPKIDRTRKLKYKAKNFSNQIKYSHYASYDELVEWLKPGNFRPKPQPSMFNHCLNQFLGQLI